MDVQRDGGDREGGVFRLAGPVQLRVQVRVVGAGFLCPGVGVGVGCHQPDGRVVGPLLALVLVGLDRALGFG